MFAIRTATAGDTALITAHRRAMFASMPAPISATGPNAKDSVLDAMSRTFEPWVHERIAAGKYLGWIAEENGRVAGSAGLLILDWPPHLLHPTETQRAYLLNVYVEPEFRKRGLAHQLLERSMAEARERKICVVTLHTSDAGRAVYEKFGFRPTSEMMHVELAER